jgi:hypothetical protein
VATVTGEPCSDPPDNFHYIYRPLHDRLSTAAQFRSFPSSAKKSRACTPSESHSVDSSGSYFWTASTIPLAAKLQRDFQWFLLLEGDAPRRSASRHAPTVLSTCPLKTRLDSPFNPTGLLRTFIAFSTFFTGPVGTAIRVANFPDMAPSRKTQKTAPGLACRESSVVAQGGFR